VATNLAPSPAVAKSATPPFDQHTILRRRPLTENRNASNVSSKKATNLRNAFFVGDQENIDSNKDSSMKNSDNENPIHQLMKLRSDSNSSNTGLKINGDLPDSTTFTILRFR
jgi:hypothetical protein